MRTNLEYLPSNSQELLNCIKGACIKTIRRFSSLPLDLVEERLSIRQDEFFSLVDGPMLFEMDNGISVAISTDDSLNSLLLWKEPLKDELGNDDFLVDDRDYSPIDSCDLKFNNLDWETVLGRVISEVQIVKDKNPYVTQEALPNETSLKILFENSNKAILLGYRIEERAVDLSIGIIEI